jgi:hypothetical protein
MIKAHISEQFYARYESIRKNKKIFFDHTRPYFRWLMELGERSLVKKNLLLFVKAPWIMMHIFLKLKSLSVEGWLSCLNPLFAKI